LKKRRYDRGALDLETIEARAVVKQGAVVGIEVTKKSRARSLIEDFMIAANGVTARYLTGRGIPSLRRVLKVPNSGAESLRWPRSLAPHCPPNPPHRPSMHFSPTDDASTRQALSTCRSA
jgi:exoribonuclease-2